MNFQRSEALFRRANDLVAGGVSSQIRRGERPVPLFFVRGKGGKLWDADGNEYVDYVQGMGPNIFGHAPDFIIEAVERDMKNGFVYAGQFERELEVAELALSMVPLGGLVRFASSGTEIDQLVLRLARGYTGRPKYLKFEGHYHGWTDTVLYSVHPPLDQAGPDDAPVPAGESQGMAPGSANDIVIAPWNDLATLEEIFEREAGQIAGVIMEPILANTNCILPKPGYLEGVRDLCHRHGSVLIFDEVITGFRVSAGGAQALLGVTPDLATYAKSMAGGFPIAMLVGKPEIMKLVADGTVYHGGSFNSNVMSVAAAHASLSHIAADPDGFYRDLTDKGLQLMDGLRSAARRAEADLLVQGIGPVFATSFTTKPEISDYREQARYCDEAKHRKFVQLMLENGIRLATNGRWHMASTHTGEEIERTIRAAEKSLRAL
ncbi:MAG: aspartate aminotransferase family protein [Chloroflexi bacterium]|nr:aspartate aminotransferase family protein [Chloroflexota bacterium]